MQSEKFPQRAFDIIPVNCASYRFFAHNDGKPGVLQLIRSYQDTQTVAVSLALKRKNG